MLSTLWDGQFSAGIEITKNQKLLHLEDTNTQQQTATHFNVQIKDIRRNR